MTKKSNMIIYLLALGAAVVGTAESIIAGILEMVASDVQITTAAAGQLVTAYSAAYAIGTPIIVALTSKVDRKKILAWALLIFIIGNVVSIFSSSYAVLMLSRVVLGASAGVFAVVALGVAAKSVPIERRGNAIGTVLMGTSLSLVVGLPLGTLIGAHLGWRYIFVVLGLLALIPLVALQKSIPKMTGEKSIPLSQQLTVLKDVKVIAGLMTSLLFITGYSVIYTYISPILHEMAQLDSNTISLVLLGCGVMAVIGSRVGGASADKWGIAPTLIFSLLLHALALFLLPVAVAGMFSTLLIMALWMFGAWTTAPAQQFYLVTLAPKSSDIILSLNSSAFHIGVAIGSGVGGLIVERSLPALGWMGGIVVILGLFFSILSMLLRKAQEKSTVKHTA